MDAYAQLLSSALSGVIVVGLATAYAFLVTGLIMRRDKRESGGQPNPPGSWWRAGGPPDTPSPRPSGFGATTAGKGRRRPSRHAGAAALSRCARRRAAITRATGTPRFAKGAHAPERRLEVVGPSDEELEPSSRAEAPSRRTRIEEDDE